MTKARTLADNFAADINAVTASAPLTGGGTSGTVTVGIQDGTTSQKGAVQLEDSTASTSTTNAATPNSVKSAFDLANGAIAKSLVDAKADLITATANDTPARLAVGTDGQYLQADSTTATGLKWATASSGVKTFSYKKTFSSDINVVYYANSTWVAAGNGGILETSSDGITWTSRTSGFGSNNIFGITYGNGVWVAVGSNGTITTSTDLSTWTARTSNVSTNILRGIRYINGNFVAVGAGANNGTGGITTSTDGTTWTKRTTPGTTNATTLYDVNYGNGYYVAVGTGTSVNTSAYHSTDLSTWTAFNCADGGAGVYAVYYENGYWIIFGDSSGLFFTRATNPTGTFTQSAASVYYSNSIVGGTARIHTYNGFFVLPGNSMPYINQHSTTLTSTNDRFKEFKAPISIPTYQNDVNGIGGIAVRCCFTDTNGNIAFVASVDNRSIYLQG